MNIKQFTDHVSKWILVSADIVLVKDGRQVVSLVHYYVIIHSNVYRELIFNFKNAQK